VLSSLQIYGRCLSALFSGCCQFSDQVCKIGHELLCIYSVTFRLFYCDVVLRGRVWLDKCPLLLALALYTYLRVIVDHGGPIFAQLRQREVNFCVSLMRQRVSVFSFAIVQHDVAITTASSFNIKLVQSHFNVKLHFSLSVAIY